MISAEALNQFKLIIKQDYGFELDDIEAAKLARDYLTALEAVLKPPRIVSLEDHHLTKPTGEGQNED